MEQGEVCFSVRTHRNQSQARKCKRSMACHVDAGGVGQVWEKYPRNGEIDIMEHLNFDNIIYQTTHSYYTLDLGQKENPKHFGTASVNIDAYNIYGISWYPDRIVFQLNGVDTFTYPRVDGVDPSQWPYDQPFYLLIDQQLGGSWVGEVNQDKLPVEMRVDWVKVYQ
ncbi:MULTISPECIES: glycoside hydrolase family 16 protein [Sphingobacterium]|nr:MULTISPECIES: glycoside hydrolase family 16 protein [Sphingobacterium]